MKSQTQLLTLLFGVEPASSCVNTAWAAESPNIVSGLDDMG